MKSQLEGLIQVIENFQSTIQAAAVVISKETCKKENSPRASQRNFFGDDGHLRQEDQKKARVVEPTDNKRKGYFKYEEKAYKKSRVNDDKMTHEFTSLNIKILRR